MASFTSSVLSSKDHLSLMIGGLQMVELLLSKASAEFKSSFRREGVLHEIEMLAERPLPPRHKRSPEHAPAHTAENARGGRSCRSHLARVTG